MRRATAAALQMARAAYSAWMIPLFLGLTMANLTALLIAATLGYLHAYGRSTAASVGQGHVLAGALALVICVAAHCVVFTYFIATAKWAQHAVTVKNLAPALTAPTRSFKAQAFPAALGAMGAVFIAAIFGVALDARYDISHTWHHLLAITAIGVNLWAAVREYNAIRRNGQMIDRILEEIGKGA